MFAIAPPAWASRGRPWAGETVALAAAVPVATALLSAAFAGAGQGSVRDVWSEPQSWWLLLSTLELSALAATISMLPAILLAAAVARLSRRWALLIVMLSSLPLLLPSSLLASSWIVALGRQGVLTPMARVFLGHDWTIFSFGGAATALAMRYFGVVCAILIADRMRRENLWPVREVFRPSPLKALRHLTIKPSLGPLLSGWIIIALLCMNDSVLPDMLLVTTCGSRMLILFSAFLDPNAAAAVALPAAIAGAAVAIASFRMLRPLWQGLEEFHPVRRPCRRWEVTIRVAAAAVILSLPLGLPLLVLAFRAGSLEAVGHALSGAWAEAVHTTWASVLSGVATTALAATLVEGLLYARLSGKSTLAPLVLVNLVVPPALVGIGVVRLCNYWPLAAIRDSAWPLLLAYVARFLPVAMLLLYAAWRHEDPLPRAAAAVYRLSWLHRLRHVTWPRRRASLLAAALLCTLLAATEVDMSVLLSPAGDPTLGVRLATMIHTSSDASVSGLALATLALLTPAIAVLVIVSLLPISQKAARQ